MNQRGMKVFTRLAMLTLAIVFSFAMKISSTSYAAEMFHNPILGETTEDATDWSYVKIGTYPQNIIKYEPLVEQIDEAIGNKCGECYIDGKRYIKVDESFCSDTAAFIEEAEGAKYLYFEWEPIVWKVLYIDEQNGKMLVLADKALDCKPFSMRKPGVPTANWENSTVRSWLNGYDARQNSYRKDFSDAGENFITTAFGKSEQSAILSTKLDNGSDCNATTDKVFLLSQNDVRNPAYGFAAGSFSGAVNRMASYSNYALMMGCNYSEIMGKGVRTSWMTRSSALESQGIMRVIASGWVIQNNDPFDKKASVIPAMWIDINSKEYTITNESGMQKYYRVNVSDDGNSTVVGKGVYENKEKVTVLTAGKAGYSFEGWYENNTLVSKDAAYTFEVTSNRNLLAVWSKNPHTEKITVSKNEYTVYYGKNDVIERVVLSKFKNTATRKLTVSTVKIGNSKVNVDEIGKNAFKGNKKLTEVTVGSQVKTIAESAFNGCKALKKVTIGSGVNKIGKNAFYNCKNLKSVTIKTTKLTSKNVGANAFKKINASAVVKVPAKKLKAYKSLLKKKGISGKKQKIKK